jgi:hypothetical protein
LAKGGGGDHRVCMYVYVYMTTGYVCMYVCIEV